MSADDFLQIAGKVLIKRSGGGVLSRLDSD
jgi:hypothetical protein